VRQRFPSAWSVRPTASRSSLCERRLGETPYVQNCARNFTEFNSKSES
jgi:hypothetical protein